MITPGILPLSIIRGIEFDSVVLQFRDQNAVVTGTLSPGATGTYIASGNYGGLPLYVLEGSPSYFLYYNIAAASYVIAGLLTDAALTNFWSPASPLTEPTGTYSPHGANTGTATVADNPVNLSGFGVQAQVRRTPSAEIYINLNPSITNPSVGEVTIPSISNANTKALTFTGNFEWDLVLVDGSGNRIGPYIKGPFPVSDNITQV